MQGASLQKYFLTALFVIIAVALTLLLWNTTTQTYFLLLTAVSVSAWYGGFRPGVFAVGLSFITGFYFLVLREMAFTGAIRLAMFTLVGLLLTYLISSLKTANENLARQTESLRESEQRFSGAFENASTGIALVSPEGRWLEVNRSLSEITGYSENELLSRTFQDITHPNDLENDLENFKRLLSGEIRGYEIEKRYIHKQGCEIWALLSVSLVRDSRNNPLYLVAQIQDITDARRAREERARLLLLEREARQAAESAVIAKDRGVATVAHELRTPLTSLMLWARMLADGKLDEETASQALKTIVNNSKSLSLMINDLLDAQLMNRGNLHIENASLKLREVLAEAVEAIQPTAAARNINLNTDFDDRNSGELIGDAARLQQVFWNLLSNAIKFTPDGGTIAVSLSFVEGTARITISDDGDGISQEVLPRIFERFYQGEISENTKGLGLGLAISQHLVELHGGQIEARSDGVGEGAEFIVNLPLSSRRQPVQYQIALTNK